jgi:DNA helicase-2/ATP-dependent DNA helicase PcrA
MRMLKVIYVDGVPPRGILATTFTKKAAGELLSRLLSWGYEVHEYLLADEKLPKMQRLWLEQEVDINQVWTGTIDSLCEELLRDFPGPGTDPPTLADEFVASTPLLRALMFGNGRYKVDDLDKFLSDPCGTDRFGWHLCQSLEVYPATGCRETNPCRGPYLETRRAPHPGKCRVERNLLPGRDGQARHHRGMTTGCN